MPTDRPEREEDAARLDGGGIFPKEPLWTWERIISAALLVGWVAVCWHWAGPQCLRGIWAPALALICIWWPETMGAYTGPSGIARRWITRPSPECAVRALGWAVLIASWAVVLYAHFAGGN